MKAIFKKTEGDYLEATLEIGGAEMIVMDEFGGNRFMPGDDLDVRISVGLHYEDEKWESMFSGNPTSRKELVHQSSWRYRAYGVITGIYPEVTVNVGVLQLSAPISTSDPKVIGESIAFTIDRLDAYDS